MVLRSGKRRSADNGEIKAVKATKVSRKKATPRAKQATSDPDSNGVVADTNLAKADSDIKTVAVTGKKGTREKRKSDENPKNSDKVRDRLSPKSPKDSNRGPDRLAHKSPKGPDKLSQKSPKGSDKGPDKLSQKSPKGSDKGPDKLSQKSPKGSDKGPDKLSQKSPKGSDKGPDKSVQKSPKDSDKGPDKLSQKSPKGSDKGPDKLSQKSPKGSDKGPAKLAQKSPKEGNEDPDRLGDKSPMEKLGDEETNRDKSTSLGENSRAEAPEDDDDEAPESEAFSSARERILGQMREAREKERLKEAARKEERKRKRERSALEKAAKNKRKRPAVEEKLPENFLEEISQQKRVNTVKKFSDEDELADSDNEGDEANPSRFQVVSGKDLKGLSHVSEEVLNFRQKMLFGDRYRREGADERARKRIKVAASGANRFA